MEFMSDKRVKGEVMDIDNEAEDKRMCQRVV